MFYKKFLTSFFLTIFICSSQLNASSEAGYAYLYAPGIVANGWVQMGRYCKQYTTSTGEKVQAPEAIEALSEPAIACNFGEVILQNGFTLNLYKLLWYFLAKLQIARNKLIITGDNKNSVFNYWINTFKLNIGQSKDLSCFAEQYNNYIQENPTKNIVLYGASRGASVLLNFLGDQKNCNNIGQVKAAVAEAPFESLEKVLELRFPFIAQSSFGLAFLKAVLALGTSYKLGEKSQLETLTAFPTDIPVLIVTSLCDKKVPCQAAYKFYNKLCQLGHKNVDILVLNNSNHCQYTFEHETDRVIYQNVLHAFYQKHNLPHNAEYALAGQAYLSQEAQQEQLNKLNKLNKIEEIGVVCC